jgi:hypothetical protein
VRESGLLTIIGGGGGRRRARAPSKLTLTCGVGRSRAAMEDVHLRSLQSPLILHASKSPVGEWKALEM